MQEVETPPTVDAPDVDAHAGDKEALYSTLTNVLIGLRLISQRGFTEEGCVRISPQVCIGSAAGVLSGALAGRRVGLQRQPCGPDAGLRLLSFAPIHIGPVALPRPSSSATRRMCSSTPTCGSTWRRCGSCSRRTSCTPQVGPRSPRHAAVARLQGLRDQSVVAADEPCTTHTGMELMRPGRLLRLALVIHTTLFAIRNPACGRLLGGRRCLPPKAVSLEALDIARAILACLDRCERGRQTRACKLALHAV